MTRLPRFLPWFLVAFLSICLFAVLAPPKSRIGKELAHNLELIGPIMNDERWQHLVDLDDVAVWTDIAEQMVIFVKGNVALALFSATPDGGTVNLLSQHRRELDFLWPAKEKKSLLVVYAQGENGEDWMMFDRDGDGVPDYRVRSKDKAEEKLTALQWTKVD